MSKPLPASPARRQLLRLSLGSGVAALSDAGRAAAPLKKTLGLVLGAGSARGFAHIGVLKSLVQAGIKPDVVVGTSAGSLIGAFFAAGVSPWQIEDVALRTKESDIADFINNNKRGLLNGEAVARFVNEALKGAQIENLRLRYAAVATDLHNGEAVVFKQGSVADAVRASCSVPGVFVPWEVNGRELVDGGLVAPVPVSVARQMGCDTVIAVDISTKPHRDSLPGLYEVLLQSFEIMGRALSNREAELANVAIRPDTSRFASSNFNARREMIQSGYEATQRALPEIKRLLSLPKQVA